MFENTMEAKHRHQRFVERVVLSRVVWGLKGTDGWASSVSTAPGSQGREVIPFWSDSASANQCAREAWNRYEATEIPLELFIQRWLPRRHELECPALRP
jgi:hypothetical protein